ncbi:hypothetical protein [Bacillus kwashiorkori]|uniref:hypothetical protein n=1 Tax=Bacillus kwashiorkori TaxID=1522318 RepID=UPI00078396DF|nr:hypothetical protein [Bacillus kwashiorkori]
MGELFINYGIFFIVFIIFAVIATIISRSKILTTIFRITGVLFIHVLKILLFLLFIVFNSVLAGIAIYTHPFFLGKSHFYVAGKPLNPFDFEDSALLIFACSYGVIYVIMFYITIIYFRRTRLPDLLNKFSLKLVVLYRYRSRRYSLDERVDQITNHLIASIGAFLLYPFFIPIIFPGFRVSLIGNLAVFIILLLFALKPTEPHLRDNDYNQ